MRMTGVRPEVGARLIHLPLSQMQFFAFGGAHFWVFPCLLCQPFQPCQRGGMNQRTSLLDKRDVFLLLHLLTSLLLGVDLACLLDLIVDS